MKITKNEVIFSKEEYEDLLSKIDILMSDFVCRKYESDSILPLKKAMINFFEIEENE